MSLLTDFEQRTAWKHERITGSFFTNPNVSQKVDEEGGYRTFPGTTVVFQCTPQMIECVTPLQEELHQQLHDTGMPARRLPASTFHMTLHDLVSPPLKADSSLMEYFSEMDESIRRADPIVRELKEKYSGKSIRLVPDHVVNMVSISLVMMLRPETEADFELLLEMYHRFDDVVSLPYPLTPHITLAYFRPCMIDGEKLGIIVDSLNSRLRPLPVFVFPVENLTAQRFMDMENYIDVL